MRNLDILAAESGEHVRVLLCREEQSYVVSCQHFRMPYPVASDLLAELQPVPAETYSVFVLDEDITNRQREGRNRKLDLIAPLLEDACIYDKSHRNEVVRQIAAEHGIARRTVLQYLWRYWVYQSKNALLPAERPAPEQHELTADEKAIRWALNKYYYTPQRQSLQTAYKMMLRAKYCDARGTLKAEYPTFWQFRYFFRKNRDPISETISRQGLKAYQRNHRPFTGSVCDYAHTIGVYMTDATVADIYIVSRLSRKPIGRPIIYTMVDAYSRLITGVYVGLEGGQYALRLLLQNTFTDKVSFCHQHGIDIDPQDWPSHHLPTKIMTDRGSEFVAGTLENLCESYHIEILAKLLYNAQKQVILDGREKLDLEVFESAFLRNLGMVSEYISGLSAKPVVKRQAKTTPEVSVGSAAPSKIVGNDIRMLLKKAKKSGELPVSAYAEYIKGEVAI